MSISSTVSDKCVIGEPIWLNNKNRPLNHRTFALAALGGHLDVIKWLKCNGFRWASDTCSNASLGGHTEVLIFALENGCPWSDSVITNAALHGHLDIIKWCFFNKFYALDANNINIYFDSCMNASSNGHISILKWFYVKGFPMKSKLKLDMYKKASIGEHSEILSWLERIGCFSKPVSSDNSDNSDTSDNSDKSEESFVDNTCETCGRHSTRVNRRRYISMYESEMLEFYF